MQLCPIRKCDRPSRNKRKGGLCPRHANNLKNYGHAIPVRDMTVEEVLEHVGFTRTPSGCLEWNGPKNEHGYGRLNIKRLGILDQRVHRVVWQLKHGPIPPGISIRHKCANPPCADEDHLEPGTHAENMADMSDRGRHWKQGREVCDAGHDLTAPDATRNYSDGSRCVQCRRIRTARYKARKDLASAA